MDDELYKEAVMRTCAEVPDPALSVAPLPENDLGVAQICPSCSGLDAQLLASEDIEIANCPDCGCAFSPKIESLSRQIIRRLTERRNRRVKTLARTSEALSPTTPPGIDPDDYAAFRLAVDGHPDEEEVEEPSLPI